MATLILDCQAALTTDLTRSLIFFLIGNNCFFFMCHSSVHLLVFREIVQFLFLSVSFFLIGAYPAIFKPHATITVVKHLQEFSRTSSTIYVLIWSIFSYITVYIAVWQHSCCFNFGSLCHTLFFLQLQLFYGLFVHTHSLFQRSLRFICFDLLFSAVN